MKQYLLIIFSLTGIFGAFAQRSDNRFEGYVVYSDGTRKDQVIEVEDPALPWTFQYDVRTFDKALLAAGKIKKEQKKALDPIKVKEYGFGNRKFVAVSYYIKGDGEDNILKSAYGKFKGDKNTDFFAEVIRDGKVKMLKFYIPPIITDEDYEDDKVVAEKENKAKSTFDILLVRDGFKPESIDGVSFKTFFSDCDAVVKKYEANKYRVKPGKSLKSMFKGDKLPGARLEEAALQVLADYDASCR